MPFTRNIPYILILLALGCNHQPQQPVGAISTEAEKQNATENTDNAKYYTTKDTLLFVTATGDTVKYAKNEFNQSVDNHPELYNEYPEEPDQTYYCNARNGQFESEIGHDNYYVLYAYFLQQKNGIDRYAERRKVLIDIYININSIFQHLQYGGTYFGHQHPRILAYAEYSTYLFAQSHGNLEKTYDVTRQKNLYVKSLRQLIADESKIDNNTSGKEKLDRIKKLNQIVDDLDKLITDNFYLKRAQEFQYRHYEYY